MIDLELSTAAMPAEIPEIAWDALNRLHSYMKLMAAGKGHRKTLAAIGRELTGFIWAVGIILHSHF